MHLTALRRRSLGRGALRTRRELATQTTSKSFIAALQTTLVPEKSRGSSTPTYTRASPAYQEDFEGKYNLVPSGAARMQGARMVQNLLTFTETLDHVGWSASVTGTGTSAITTNFAVAPDGTTTAARLVATRGTGRGDWEQTIGNSSAVIRRITTWIKSNTGASQSVNLYDGNVAEKVVTVTTAWKRMDAGTFSASNNVIYRVGTGTAGADASIDVLIWHPQVELVTGQANQNPSEYVPNDTAVYAAPWTGANVSGVKCFSTLNGNTVASNVVTEATGALITSAAAEAAGGVTVGVVDAYGPLGYLSEGARTNDALQSQDFSTTWTNSGTATVTLNTAVAPDGTTTMDTITLGAPAVSQRYQPVITAASVYTLSVYAKVASGTKLFRLKLYDGSDHYSSDLTATTTTQRFTFTPPAALASGSSNISVANGTDAVAGDIIVWGYQFEVGAFASSYIPTTTVAVSRAADVLTYPTAGNLSQSAGTFYAEIQVPAIVVTNTNPSIIMTSDANNTGFLIHNNQIKISDSVALRAGNTFNGGTTVDKVAVSYSGIVSQTALNGTLAAASVFSGNLQINGTSFGIGESNNGSGVLNGTIRNVRIWNKALPTSELQRITT